MKKLLIFLVLFASLKGFSQVLPSPNTAWNHARFTGNLHNTVLAMDITSTSTRGVTFDVFEGQLITDSIYASKAFVRYIKDSIVAYAASVYATKTTSLTINGTSLTIDQNRSWSVGTVTNISSGYGMSFSTITSSGSIIADSLTLASWKRLYKVSDSMFSVLNNAIGLKLNISDTANMLAGYQRQGQGVVFVYDSLSFSGLGTGASPFTLLTQTGFTAGVYTAPTVTVNNKGIITAIINGSGSVGPYLFLPTQSTAVPTPVGGINLYDSSGLVWIRSDAIRRVLNWTNATVNRRMTIPDKTDTLAVLGAQIFHGSQTFESTILLVNGTGSATFTEASSGGLTIALSGNSLTIPNTNVSNLTLSGVLQTNTATNSNLYSYLGGTATSASVSQIEPTAATTVYFRRTYRGSTGATPAASADYAGSIFGQEGVTINASGTHNLFATAAFIPPTITTGAGTLTEATTLYISDAPNLGTNKYALHVNSGNTKLDGDVTVKRQILTQPGSVTATASTTLDLSTGNVIAVAMNANITTLTLSNPQIGRYFLKLTQDGTGGRTITWPAAVKWSGGTAPTLSAANKTDIIILTYDGTNYYGTSQLNY